MQSAASEILKAISPIAAQRDIKLESFMPDSELTVDVDWDRIVRVLTNLVSNATKTVTANGHIHMGAKDTER